MQGLAQQPVQPQFTEADVQQIAQLLSQGVSPEELMAQGVPEELIQAAMGLLSQNMPQPPMEGAGLAQSQGF
jgi:hypothetical protein